MRLFAAITYHPFSFRSGNQSLGVLPGDVKFPETDNSKDSFRMSGFAKICTGQLSLSLGHSHKRWEGSMILVTGASGKNGAEILRLLSGRIEQIRAMVRSKRNVTSTRPNYGLEFVEADFEDAASLRNALKGVQRAFLVTNSSERVQELQLRFVGLARESGVRHIVYLSQLHAAADSPLRFLRYHAAVEEAIRASGMSFTHLRPNLYMQGLLMIGQSIASEGRFFAPAGEAKVSVVDVRDVAAVAVAALTQSKHEGKTYDITGPQALTHGQMAEQLSQALDRPITFVDLPDQEFRNALSAMHMPDWQADGLIEDFAHYRRGEAAGISSVVRECTGKGARTFAVFAQDYREHFLAPVAVHG
jgi:uncharacterized protein YbjT (DUF2867 family)